MDDQKLRTSVAIARPAGFWAAVSPGLRLVGAAVVFLLFASVGFVTLMMDPREHGARDILLYAILSGVFAVGFAAFSVARKYGFFALLIVLRFSLEFLDRRFRPLPQSLAYRPEALEKQLLLLGIGAMASIFLGYILLIFFVRGLGTSYFRIKAEMGLAADIHRALVPEIRERLRGFELFGRSRPSGAVGGDLVDVAASEHRWTGYIADVSGHGVSSGVLMAMFKTAMRTRLIEGDSPAQALEAVHKTLLPLKPPQMFITAAVVEHAEGGQIFYASAGHPPLLHYRKASSEVMEYPPLDPPVGLMDGQTFSQSPIDFARGDVLVVLTDGLTEVFDSQGNELGLDRLKPVLAGSAGGALSEIVERLQSTARSFGAQVDDQTMLVARRLE
ncbi:MAG: serine/threonine-protein phosphatase [Acidobacteria bacterium]|nr:serine/threonine-protein phosphatase [Acidobacteriota bacterium]